jgi:hypothetical protein
MVAAGSTATGDVLFARYAFPPNELGYCGPADPDVLLRHATSGGEPADEITRRARQFEGAWVYLEEIAAAAGIADPMDTRVVEAYWIGNELLDAVDPARFLATLKDRFAGQLVGPAARRWRSMPPAHALAHHGFHVFAVYPWAGLLGVRAGNRTVHTGQLPDPVGHRGRHRRRAAQRPLAAAGLGRVRARSRRRTGRVRAVERRGSRRPAAASHWRSGGVPLGLGLRHAHAVAGRRVGSAQRPTN